MSRDVEFNSEQNSVINSIKSEKIYMASNQKKNYIELKCLRKEVFHWFYVFSFESVSLKYFLKNSETCAR